MYHSFLDLVPVAPVAEVDHSSLLRISLSSCRVVTLGISLASGRIVHVWLAFRTKAFTFWWRWWRRCLVIFVITVRVAIRYSVVLEVLKGSCESFGVSILVVLVVSVAVAVVFILGDKKRWCFFFFFLVITIFGYIFDSGNININHSSGHVSISLTQASVSQSICRDLFFGRGRFFLDNRV